MPSAVTLMALPLVAVVHVVASALLVLMFVRLTRLRRERDALLDEKQVVVNFLYDLSEVFAESDTVDITATAELPVSNPDVVVTG